MAEAEANGQEAAEWKRTLGENPKDPPKRRPLSDDPRFQAIVAEKD